MTHHLTNGASSMMSLYHNMMAMLYGVASGYYAAKAHLLMGLKTQVDRLIVVLERAGL